LQTETESKTLSSRLWTDEDVLGKSRWSPAVAVFSAEVVLNFQQICELREHFYTQAATDSNPVAPNDLRQVVTVRFSPP
jgi:hypothetical protein